MGNNACAGFKVFAEFAFHFLHHLRNQVQKQHVSVFKIRGKKVAHMQFYLFPRNPAPQLRHHPRTECELVADGPNARVLLFGFNQQSPVTAS